MARSPGFPVLLLTGGSGYLGRRLLPYLAHRWRVAAPSRAPENADALAIDLARPETLKRVFELVRPTAVVNAAALASPDDCERDPKSAYRVNVEGPRALAALCAETGARLVHFSTDLVFDGEKGWYTESDKTHPLSTYGRSKLESEHAVLAACPGAAVLRLSNCYGRRVHGRRTYLDHLRAQLTAGRSVPSFVDQWRTSTAADQIPEVVHAALVRPSVTGIFHWGGADRASRFETAIIFCRTMGFDERLIKPAHAAGVRFSAPRPRDTSLRSLRLSAVLGISPVGLEEGFKALRDAETPLD